MFPSDGGNSVLLVEPSIAFELLLCQRGGYEEESWVAGHHRVHLVDLGGLD